MSTFEQILTIAIAAVTNFLTRWLPFAIFTNNKSGRQNVAPFVKGLGDFLPPAIMMMLVVYCYRNLDWGNLNSSIPEILAGIITVVIHVWRRSMFLSLIVGTLSYILLLNFVF